MLKILILDPDEIRRSLVARHLERRFEVLQLADVGAALTRFREARCAAVLASWEQSISDGLKFAAGLRAQAPHAALLVYGVADHDDPPPALIRQVDTFIPAAPDPALLEAMLWSSVVRRHQLASKGDEESASEERASWTALLDQEPRLRQVKRVLTADLKDLWRKGQVDTDTAAPHMPAVMFIEPDTERRRALKAHFAGRITPLFPGDTRETLDLLENPDLLAVVIRHLGRAGSVQGLVAKLRSTARGRALPIIAHGGAGAQRIPGLDINVVQDLAPPLLEVLLWEQAHPAPRPAPTATAAKGGLEVRDARRSADEQAERSSWADLLKADASLDSLRVLLKKEVTLPAAPASAERDELSWAELLNSEVNVSTLKALMTRDIQLFGKR